MLRRRVVFEAKHPCRFPDRPARLHLALSSHRPGGAFAHPGKDRAFVKTLISATRELTVPKAVRQETRAAQLPA
jgi:transcription-repair coupling factor (superfamily II helicase)